MATPPDFSVGQTLTAAHMDAIGLWLIETKSVTSQSTVSFDNCFTSSFTNYLINVDITASANNILYMKLRAAGSDSSTSYYYGGYYIDMTAATLTAEGSTNVNTGFRLGAFSNNAYGSTTYLYKPALAAKTIFTCAPQAVENYSRFNGGYHDLATAYDGCTFSTGTSTMTGTIRIYGLRN
jgi:hypothetical protein